MADPGSPRGSETSAIDLTFALEAAGETQPQRASDKASGEWLPFTAAGDTPTYAAAVSPTHASPLRRPRSRGVNAVSFDAAPDLGVLGGFRKCVNCDRAATRWCSRATWPSWAAPDESKARTPRVHRLAAQKDARRSRRARRPAPSSATPAPPRNTTVARPAARWSLCGNQPVRRVLDNSSLSHFSAMTRPSWLCRAVRNRHHHAIEQASRRWRGGRRDDSARTRRQILISTQVGVRRVRARHGGARGFRQVLRRRDPQGRRRRRLPGLAHPPPRLPGPAAPALRRVRENQVRGVLPRVPPLPQDRLRGLRLGQTLPLPQATSPRGVLRLRRRLRVDPCHGSFRHAP